MSGFDWSLLLAPLCAGLLVCATHIPLGRRVLDRGIIFLDLTVAQVAALGVTIEMLLNHGHAHEHADWHAQLSATAGALAVALLLAWTERRWMHIQEALIGSLYVLSACLMLLLLSGAAHGHEQLNQLLAGQILWVTFDDLMMPLLVTLGVVVAMALGVARNIWGFYVLFAVSVTVSVQLVGVFLVFATLILPALAVVKRLKPSAFVIAGLIGISGYALGLACSAIFDLPSGPLIVITLAGMSLVFAVTNVLTRKLIN